jgi:uncharacterized protein (TIGR00730 family)
MSKFNRLCVFCGSSKGAKQEYIDAARELAALFSQSDIELVYGGAVVGMMGALADAVLANGGRVVGVMPKFILEKEIAHEDITELHIVNSMHERKALMAELADGFIILPGGIGSVEEFFEIVTWSQLGIHSKPFGILNVNGYYDLMLKFIDHMVNEGFLNSLYRDNIIVEKSPEKLLEALSNYKRPAVEKWSKAPEYELA